MAHFAKLDETNKVLEVIVVKNDVIIDDFGKENEELGVQFLKQTFGWDHWKQTSYNGAFRKNFAGINFTYDPVLDAFIPVKPYDSWLLNTDKCLWEPPIPLPQDGQLYFWDETIKNWVLFTQ